MAFTKTYIMTVLDDLTSSIVKMEASKNVHLLKNALVLVEFYENHDRDRQLDILLQRGLNSFDNYPDIAHSYFQEVRKTIEFNLQSFQ